jgi:hypothetical protein
MASFGKNLVHKMLLLHQIFLQFSCIGLITLGKSFIQAQGIYWLQILSQVFPEEQMSLILSLTNEMISLARDKKLTKGKLIKFFGVVILATHFEVAARQVLWPQTKKAKYKDALAFKDMGLTRSGQTLHFQSKLERHL